MSREAINALWFVGWLCALLVLFRLALRLPLQTRRPRLPALPYATLVVTAAVGATALANVALILHDVHVDLTRDRAFTPSRQAEDVVRSLTQDVHLTYFYHSADQNGRRAKALLEVLGRRHPHLLVRTVDPDKQPRLAETYGVRLYNAAVLEADGRRIQVMGTDESDIAIGILRLLRRQVIAVCFMEGHGEYPFDNFEFHTHVETLQAHTHGDKSSALVQMEGHGAGRLRRALEGLGYETRKIIPATLPSIPRDCAAVIAVNPRTTYLPAESDLLAAYLGQGGAALFMYDLGFVIESRLGALLARLGVRAEPKVVIDPLDHYSTDPESVAVPVYEQHSITSRIALTFFPGVRPLTVVPSAPGVSVTPIVRSSKESYVRPVRPVEERQVGDRATPGAPAPANAAAEDSKPGSRVLAAAVEGRWPEGGAEAKPFRVVVVGDADFASNSFFPYMSNSDLTLSMVRWLVREDHGPKVRPGIPVPALVLLTRNQMQRIFLGVEVFLPLSVMVVGVVVWWKRR